MFDRKWWLLDQSGNPLNPLRFPPRPEGSIQSEDLCHPWHHSENHLHGENGNKGIHMFGTLEEVRYELHRAKTRQSKLPIK
jgi:hypothetical protein